MRKKLFILTTLGFLFSIAPILAVLIANWSTYVKTGADVVKLGFGGIIVAVMLVMKVFGALRIRSGTTVVLLVMVLSILLARVLEDLTILCLAYLIGDLINSLFIKKKIEAIKEAVSQGKQADEVEIRTRKLLEEYMGNGRT